MVECDFRQECCPEETGRDCILEEVLSSVGVEAWQLHYPPVFTVRMKRFGDKHIMDGFAAEQKLNRMGKLVRSMYEIAVTSRRRERLRRIGFNRK